jgi:hypothetical protein
VFLDSLSPTLGVWFESETARLKVQQKTKTHEMYEEMEEALHRI